MQQSKALIEQVSNCIREFCSETSCRHIENRLAQLAAEMAKQRLWGRLRSVARFEDTTIEQQALSVVSPLFEKVGGRPLLQSALEDSLEEDDSELFYKFRAVVIRCSTQELFRRWSNFDSLSPRLWRTLRSALRTDPELVLFPVVEPEWVSFANRNSLVEMLPPVSFETLKALLADVYRPKCELSEIVRAALSQLAATQKYQHAIKLDTLFAALREVISESAALKLASEEYHLQLDAISRLAVGNARQEATRAGENILKRYLISNKLASVEIRYLRDAVADVISDLADGGPAQSFYSYLSTHWTGLTAEHYRSHIRTRFEYLVSVAQRTFYDRMRLELGR